MIDIKQLENVYFLNNEPVPYQLKCGVEILICPVSVKDWYEFGNAVGCLTINKNETKNIEIIKMKYLDFILMSAVNNKEIMEALNIVIKYSLKEEYINIHSVDGKNYLAIVDKENKIKALINSKEFDEIKSIILHQNIYDYDDRHISQDVRELYEEYLKTVCVNQYEPSLERKKIFVMCKYGKSLESINKMSYRIFIQTYIELVNIDIYFARKLIQSSSKYDVKEDIVYPLLQEPADKYEKLFVNKNSIQDKLNKIQ